MRADGEKLYRLSVVAERADLTLRTVQKHVENGDLRIVRVGPYRRPRVRESDMEKYLGLKRDDE
jgi:excisionase family DNA binding protein